MKYLEIALLFTFSLTFCESHKILAIFPMVSPSHYILSSPLLNELAKKGHEITVVTPYFEKSPHKNLKEVSVESLIDGMNQKKKKLFELEESIFENHRVVVDICNFINEGVLKHDNVQKILNSNGKFDLVMAPLYLHDSFMGIAHHFQAPMVALATMPLYSWNNLLLAHPTLPSYVPNIFTPYTGHMTFGQRLINSFYDLYFNLYHQWFVQPFHRELVKKYIPGQPDLYQFVNNISLVLINSHMSAYEAYPQIPNAVDIGGFHILEPKPLPDDLQKFLDGSRDGVIVFSMGSNIRSADLSPETVTGILKAFSKLRQNVLWKFEADNLPGQPKNVKIMKWLPQSDVLAHPNVKALITHGGLLSTTEAIYHGIPYVGIPVFTDQKMNMANAVARGYGVVLPFPQLGEETLSQAIDQVLNNPKYRDSIKARSKIMRDRPIKPMDEAIYWIEYVLRHHGAPHLRYPGMELNWLQRNLIDVIALVLLAAVVITYVCVSFVRKFFRFLKSFCKCTHMKQKTN